ncbi:MAG: 30S ribosomal protein S5 [Candidatus Margulisiibacteriota bacterium]|jgi:small subunit ribosomal protein S5
MVERKSRYEKDENALFEKVIKIDRVTKVVKGGKRLGFRALVIVGDGNGKVGLATARASEVPSAIKKAIERAKKTMVLVNIINGTVPHEVLGKFGASKVMLKPARIGRGVNAGGPVRILCEAVGLKDVVGKSLGSNSALNMAKAGLVALKSLKSYSVEARRRGFKFNGVLDRFKINENVKPEVVVITKEQGAN